MSLIKPTHVNDIEFDENDIEIFNIPDIKERIAKIKGNFFPRLEFLVNDSLELVKQVYGVEPYPQMTKVHTPNNRKDAATNKEYGVASVGISGKRRNSTRDNPLAIKNADGKSIYIHSAFLTFDVLAQGCIRVIFLPFRVSVESNFVAKVRQEMLDNIDLLNENFMDFEICYTSKVIENSTDFPELVNKKRFNLPDGRDIHSLYFHTNAFFFPTNFDDELHILKLAFVALYPLLDLFVSIGDGRKPRFSEMLNQFHDWYCEDLSQDPQYQDDETANNIESELIALPSEELDDLVIDRENIEPKLNFDPKNLKDARKRNIAAIVQRQGQSKFRTELLKAYGGQCAITDCDAEAALEAAHIVPYLGTETNCLANGLLLRADIHTLFDLHLISINPDTGKIIVSSSLLKTCYKELNDKTLKLPKDEVALISHQALSHHYQTFLNKQNKDLRKNDK
jgi:hypothetical protein